MQVRLRDKIFVRQTWTNFRQTWTNFCQTSHNCPYETTPKNKKWPLIEVRRKSQNKWEKGILWIWETWKIYIFFSSHHKWNTQFLNFQQKVQKKIIKKRRKFVQIRAITHFSREQKISFSPLFKTILLGKYDSVRNLLWQKILGKKTIQTIETF